MKIKTENLISYANDKAISLTVKAYTLNSLFILFKICKTNSDK